MTYKFSEGFPSPLVWTIKAGYYDANLIATEFVTAPRYTTDATIFPVTMSSDIDPLGTDTWFMIFGYTLDNGTLMPVFPGQYGIPKTLKISMGRFYSYPWIHMGYWSNEQRTEYVDKKVYNQPYHDYMAIYTQSGAYELSPPVSYDNLSYSANAYHIINDPVKKYDLITYPLPDNSAAQWLDIASTTQSVRLWVIGHVIENGVSYPVFRTNDLPGLSSGLKAAYKVMFPTGKYFYVQQVGVRSYNFTIYYGGV